MYEYSAQERSTSDYLRGKGREKGVHLINASEWDGRDEKREWLGNLGSFFGRRGGKDGTIQFVGKSGYYHRSAEPY